MCVSVFHIHTWSHVYVYAYTGVCTYSICMCTCVYMHVHTYIYICVCVYVYMYICIYVYMYICICMYAPPGPPSSMSRHTYMHACIHTYMHPCTRNYTHTHTRARASTLPLPFAYMIVSTLQAVSRPRASTCWCHQDVAPEGLGFSGGFTGLGLGAVGFQHRV